MLVLIGLIVQMATEGLCFPTTVFFLFVSGTFVGAAVIHPQEFMCLIHGVVYYLAIPTMFMLLMIYAMCNLNLVSWGTREVKVTPTEKQMQEEKQAEIENKKNEELKKQGKFVSVAKTDEGKDGWTMSCGTCCSYICCPHKVNKDEQILSLNVILGEMKIMENNLEKKIYNKMAELQQAVEDMKPNGAFLQPGIIYEQDGTSGYDDTQINEAGALFAGSIRSQPISMHGKLY